MSVAGAVPAFDPKQSWRVVSGDVPDCPVGTVVTLSTHGWIFDVTRPWAGVAASLDMRTTTILVSPDGRECLVRLKDGEARFAMVDPNAAAPTTQVATAAPRPVPGEFGAAHPLKYLEGTWRSPGYRSGRMRARITLGLFVVVLVGAFWELLLGIQAVVISTRAVGGNLPTVSQQDAFNRAADIAGSLYGLAIIVLAIAYFCWVSRTVDNVPPLGGGTPHDSPRWSVGWWFIPVADLWRPFMLVREAWDRLSVPARPAGGRIVETWWVTLLGGFFLGKAAQLIESNADDWKTIQIGDVVAVIGLVLYVIAAVFGFLVVREIQARADLRARALGFDGRPATFPFEPVVATATAPAADQAAVVPPITPRVQPRETADALRSLIELKDQGLVTDEEYAAKRIEILSRL